MNTETNFYDLAAIKEALAGRIDEFVLTLFPSARRESSCYKIGGITGEKGGSMMISTRANNPGFYLDFADPEVKGPPWRLVSLVKGCSIKEGIAWLANFTGTPPIQSFGSISRAKEPEKLAVEMVELTKESVDYATSRGITEETLRKYGVCSDRRGGLMFPYYDAFGKLGMVKHWGHKLKADGKKDTWIMPSTDAVQSLFGKDVCDPETGLQKLVITEGECLSGDTEVLTTEGWMRLDEYTSLENEPKMAQWDNWQLNWVHPSATVVKDFNPDKWLSFSHKQMDLLVTPGHRMVSEGKNGEIEVRLAQNWPKNTSLNIPKAGFMDGDGIPLSDDQIRLCIAVSADAAIDKRKNTGPRKACEMRYARMGFKKERKIERIREILKACDITPSDNETKAGQQSICFPIPWWVPGRILPMQWLEHATLKQREIILEELIHWDGNSVPNRNQTEYSSKYIENATWVQTLAATVGISATIIPRSNQYGNWFKVSLLHSKRHCGHQRKPKQVKGGDTAYCVTVPSGMILVRRNNKICVTGNCDAMVCWQLGIPAVSIPMGASNTKWITEDYQYLSHFDEIVLLFDNDDAGKKGAKEAAARLGAERCLIVTLPLKDANDMLRAGRGEEIRQIIETTTREPMAEIVDPSSMMEGTRSYMRGDHLTEGDPFFIPDYALTFRRHETTLWFGFTGHGKSVCVANQIASLASRGKLICVASFEQPPEMTFAQILTQFTAYPNLPYTDEFVPAYNHLAKHVFMYKSMERVDPKHLVNTFVHAHKRYGVDTFVIDNVMTMQIDRGDNTAQAEAADLLRVFVSKYPVHLHIVAHPRKPPENTNKPPAISEIRGASEWADMVFNVVTVWRDTAKAERLAEMDSSDFTDEDQKTFFNSTPCGKIITRKQRATGEWPMTSFWYHKATRRLLAKPGEPSPLYSQKPWI